MRIAQALAGISATPPSLTSVRNFVDLCHRMAFLYLEHRLHRKAFGPDFFGLSSADLAFDCVAALFGRDRNGRFSQIETYFEALDWKNLSEEDLLSYTRRLVFSKVHQEFSKLCKESDPSLEKLIRNLKNALRKSGPLTERRIGGEAWVLLKRNGEKTRGLPLMSPDYLEARLSPVVREHTPLRQVLMAVSEIFESSESYQKRYPLTGLALIIRMAFVRGGWEDEMRNDIDLNRIHPSEIGTVIGLSVEHMKSNLTRTYIGRGKIDRQTYEHYFDAVADILRAEFIGQNGHDTSFYQFLVAYVPLLTKQQYQENHRCHIEYLAKLTRTEFLSRIARELK